MRRSRLAPLLLLIVSACGTETALDDLNGRQRSPREPSSADAGEEVATELPPPRPGFTAVEGDIFAHFKRVKFDARRFDGVALREVQTAYEIDPACTAATAGNRFIEEATWGDPCTSAPDVARCTDDLACKVAPAGWVPDPRAWTRSRLFFLTVKRGVFTFVTTRAELVGVLGRIDTVEAAILLAAIEGGPRSKVLGYRIVNGAVEVLLQGGGACTDTIPFQAVVRIDGSGNATEVERTDLASTVPTCNEGRRPTGLRECPTGGIMRGLGAYLAEAAHLEAAAVVAFEQLAITLHRFGAPANLLRDIEFAKADEKRHARIMTRLASIHDFTPKAVDVLDDAEHTLESLALENIVEGCLRETYAALRAAWQAQHATDRRLRAAFTAIAEDEAAHAELAWAIDAFLEPKLDAEARAGVRSARDRALLDLERELGVEPHPDVRRLAGMPDARTACLLLRELVERTALAA